MSEHFIAAADHGFLRIYGETTSWGSWLPRIELVRTADLNGDDAQDRAGATPRGAAAVRLRARPVKPGPLGGRNDLRRQAERLACELDSFLHEHATASWDFAVSAALYRAVVDDLSGDVLRRMKRVFSPELLSRRLDEIGATVQSA